MISENKIPFSNKVEKEVTEEYCEMYEKRAKKRYMQQRMVSTFALIVSLMALARTLLS